jgi:hypothetical protein
MKRIQSIPTLRLAFEILLVIVLMMAAFPDTITTHATAQQAPEVPTALYWYQCNAPNHIGLFSDRLHIFCQTTAPIAGAPALDSAIFWFAYPTSPDSAGASRFMSLLQTSVITSRLIWLQVDPSDTSGNSFGCGGANCRRIYGMEMR